MESNGSVKNRFLNRIRQRQDPAVPITTSEPLDQQYPNVLSDLSEMKARLNQEIENFSVLSAKTISDDATIKPVKIVCESEEIDSNQQTFDRPLIFQTRPAEGEEASEEFVSIFSVANSPEKPSLQNPLQNTHRSSSVPIEPTCNAPANCKSKLVASLQKRSFHSMESDPISSVVPVSEIMKGFDLPETPKEVADACLVERSTVQNIAARGDQGLLETFELLGSMYSNRVKFSQQSHVARMINLKHGASTKPPSETASSQGNRSVQTVDKPTRRKKGSVDWVGRNIKAISAMGSKRSSTISSPKTQAQSIQASPKIRKRSDRPQKISKRQTVQRRSLNTASSEVSGDWLQQQLTRDQTLLKYSMSKYKAT